MGSLQSDVPCGFQQSGCETFFSCKHNTMCSLNSNSSASQLQTGISNQEHNQSSNCTTISTKHSMMHLFKQHGKARWLPQYLNGFNRVLYLEKSSFRRKCVHTTIVFAPVNEQSAITAHREVQDPYRVRNMFKFKCVAGKWFVQPSTSAAEDDALRQQQIPCHMNGNNCRQPPRSPEHCSRNLADVQHFNSFWGFQKTAEKQANTHTQWPARLLVAKRCACIETY